MIYDFKNLDLQIQPKKSTLDKMSKIDKISTAS